MKDFFDLFTVLFLKNYKSRPLHLLVQLVLAFIILGFLIELYLVFKWFMGFEIGSRPLFLGILLLIVGIQSFFFGLIGEMIAGENKVKIKSSSKIFND